ncbi:MAG: hydroxylamine dehydrogenase [Halobacteriales archaeon]|jgi:hydroxylamine dehydrogenase
MATYPVRGITWVVGLAIVAVVIVGVTAAVPTDVGAQSTEANSALGATNDAAISERSHSQSAPVSNQTQRCIACHKENHPGMVRQFKASGHFKAGVDCLSCHGAKDTAPTAESHFGSVISPLVTPKDCAACHQEETEEFHNSLHDEAAFFSASAMSNNATGATVMPTGWVKNSLVHNSRASAEAGCQKCHGAHLKVLNDVHPAQPEEDVKIQGYPNQGIGRMNPDGSLGSCAACHPQHRFSIKQARMGALACKECHLGPDHPQTEIYEETKHSSMFHANKEHFNLSVEPEKFGTDDITAPTCAVCHMSGLGSASSTHDVSARLKWEAEPVWSWPTAKKYETGSQRYPIPDDVANHYEEQFGLAEDALTSVPTGAPNPFAALQANRPDLYKEYVLQNDDLYPTIQKGDEPTRWKAFGGEARASPQVKRERMKTVCTECHTQQWVDNEFEKRDRVIHIYNAVFTAAKKKYVEPLQKQAPVAEAYGASWVDSIYFEMWHHEGRRWRMGALMGGQDYEHWNGAYEVRRDILKLAHLESVYEETGAGRNGTGETQAAMKTGRERPDAFAFAPTGLSGVGLGAGIAIVGIALPVAGLYWRRNR